MNKLFPFLAVFLFLNIGLGAQNDDQYVANIIDITNKTPDGKYMNNTITIFTADSLDKSVIITNDTFNVKITVFPKQYYATYPDPHNLTKTFEPGWYSPVLVCGNKILEKQEQDCYQVIFLANEKGIGGDINEDIFFNKCKNKRSPPPFKDIVTILEKIVL